MFIEETECVVGHHVQRVLVALVLPILLGVRGVRALEFLMRVEVLVVELDPLTVTPQVGRVEVVRELLIEVAEEVVEPLEARLPKRLAPAEAPLSDGAGHVARVLQHSPDRVCAGVEWHLSQLIRVRVAPYLEVVPDL